MLEVIELKIKQLGFGILNLFDALLEGLIVEGLEHLMHWLMSML